MAMAMLSRLRVSSQSSSIALLAISLMGIPIATLIASAKSLTSSTGASSTAELKDVQGAVIIAAEDLHDQRKNYSLPHTIFHVVPNEMAPEEADIMYQFTDVRKRIS